ncbi:MAG TPA: iron ABC transporter permease [Bacteroidetes bacterium]|nr:iron ABC transporter permease [Bacteroidota bacterium]HIL58375.1 iron ABC transporter permease [Rhodothermales bacterium]
MTGAALPAEARAVPPPSPTASATLAAAAGARARRVALVLGGLAVLLVVGMVASIATGAVALSPGEVLAVLADRIGVTLPWAFTAQQEAVLLSIRLPRVLLGGIVGAGLATGGAVLQGLFRNPLADPGLVGVSSGAALGAALAIVLGASVSASAAWAGPAMVAVAAFAVGLATTAVVYRIATQMGRTSVTTMLLAGIAVNALCGAAVGALVLFADDGQLRDLTFWTLGSLGGATWSALAVAVPLVGAVLFAAPWLARSLDAMLLGEAEAGHLGVNTQRVKAVAVSLAALAVAAATAVSGLIGFVGLVAPHLIRLVLGPGHRALLPGAAFCGAALLVFADLAARLLLAPAEIPIGIVTALVGGPFFLWLLVRQRPA